MSKIKAGVVTVTTAGARVAFPSSTKKCLWISVAALEGNTGTVYLGDSTVSTTAGKALHNGTDGVHNSVEIPCQGGVDLDSFYLDSASNGDKADFIAVLE